MLDRIKNFINPDQNPKIVLPEQQEALPLPTLWLLGKTGAGKSSIIQALTGLTEVEVGNGFSPCTQTAFAWDYPTEHPVLRFLDTRGIGEASYDPEEDLALSSSQSHALVIVARVDEPEQSSVVKALQQIRKKKHLKEVLVVHTALMQVKEPDRERLVAHNQALFEKAWGGSLPLVTVDFDCDTQKYFHRDELLALLADMVPLVGLALKDKEHSTAEEKNFETLSTEVLWYASVASASDLLPAVGLVSVPAIQGKMLHSLANQYGVEWSVRTFTELVSVMGTSFGIQYGVKLGARQLGKFIPGYGQTVGAVAAATISFGTTYGLGRAASYYFYRKSRGETVDPEAVQALYKEAFEIGKKASANE